MVEIYKRTMMVTDIQFGNHSFSQKKAAKDNQSSNPIKRILNPYLDINNRIFRKLTLILLLF
jgi:hypothetical protein